MPEITLNDEFGRAIATAIRLCRIESMIEIGSWDGTGSTAVIVSALKDVPEPRLVCVEPDVHRHAALQRVVAGLPWITTVCRPSVSRAAMTPQTFEDVWNDPHNKLTYPKELVREWWDETPPDRPGERGYLETLTDERWDAALIDGGEFCGYDDFRLLRDRVRVLMLDDVFHAYKCSRAHWELGRDPRWLCLWCSAFVRNGAAIWVKAA
jgi:hypothetical protein